MNIRAQLTAVIRAPSVNIKAPAEPIAEQKPWPLDREPRTATPPNFLGSLGYRVIKLGFRAKKTARFRQRQVCVPKAWAMFLSNIY